MGTRTLEIPYPEDLPEVMGKSPEAFEQELIFLVAAKLYELGRISSGRAADLAGWIGLSSWNSWDGTASRF